MQKSIPWLSLLPLCAALLLTAATPASAERWAVLIQGNPAGFMEAYIGGRYRLRGHIDPEDGACL